MRAHRLIAVFLFAIGLVTYLSTVSDTVSFWDCGEFIAASYSLGVPHPPGAPFYLMLGRLFSMIPFSADIAYRVNLISVLVSAGTVLLLYLSLVRLGRAYRGEEKTTLDRIILYGGAAVGTLCFAFSTSFWFNAVEAEVYALSMFFTALVFYLGLKWLDHQHHNYGNALLLFIFYLFGLSSGVHLLNVLTIPALTYIVVFSRYPVTFRTVVMGGVIGSALTLLIYPGLIQGFPLIILKLTIWGALAVLVLLVYLAYWGVKKGHNLTAMAAISVLLVIVGYSTFLLIKIRSGLNPFLDENDPETWKSLLSYLNREQYGTESLFLSMFKRRAPFWSYQIKKMYLRYLGWNFFEPTRFYGIPLFIGLIGLVQQFLKDLKNGVVVFVLFFMTGLAIILYVNQEDPQPRERDYSYVGSFYAFAIWIGIGAMTILETAREGLKRLALSPQMVVISVLVFLLLIAPANMLAKNYHQQDRTGNYVAWDYSYNLLMTCEPDAILYTNGDNDTFPLWYLQVVEKVRPDVRVANLSLLNTGWFIKQIRDKEPRVPMTAKITDSYVDNVIDARDITALRDRAWARTRRVRVEGPPGTSPLEWDLPAPLSFQAGTQTLYFLRVQDFMILNTMAKVASEGWNRPIYFAVTVSDDNLLGLRNVREPHKNYLAMEGMAFKLHPQPTGLIDPDRLAYNLLQVYRYRGLDDPSVYYDENITRLLGNYRQAFIQLAFHWSQEADATGNNDTTGASWPLEERVKQYNQLPPKVKSLTALEFMDTKIPEEVIPMRYDLLTLHIARLYGEMGRPDLAGKKLKLYEKGRDLDAQKSLELGSLYLYQAQMPEKARQLFLHSLKQEPTIDNLYRVAFLWKEGGGELSWLEELYRQFIDQSSDLDTTTLTRITGHMSNLGLHNLAVEVLENFWRSQPNSRAVLLGLIDNYQKKGDLDRALIYARNWLESHPHDSVVARRMREILSRMGSKG